MISCWFPLRFSLVLAIFMVLGAVVGPRSAIAAPYESKAASALLVDVDSGTILFSKEEDAAFQPAAMAKMMTMAVVFDAIRAGKIHLQDSFPVSEFAWRTGGAPSGSATMFAKLKSTISVADLLRGAIVQAGNDACIILAEGIAGSEGGFVEMMNRKAKELGLTGSHFTNVSGLPDPAQKVTAQDLYKIADYLIRTYPDLYKIYSEPDFTWNNIYQRNRNPLLSAGIGADGLSTGFTKESGYGLTASAVRDGHRMIVVISGLESDKDRAEEARKLLDWGNTAFERLRFFDRGEAVGDARVYGGASGSVGLATQEPLDILLMRGNRERIRARISYSGPLIAPVEQGRQVGIVRIWVGDAEVLEKPLFTTAAIARGTMDQRALDAVRQLLIGWLPQWK
ncbi:D-alanyl-D-alanine carboxypeptidase family protein [Kaistia terrae]|uniref:serine-type D-Ala-D-Ala carboxypeptidase n=1 Tax=Kaistia terrae TaxID=537017 RepID=A0ABW0PSF3_9HYPH|nr:D-alanyl-D-alanine carboxypeptidase family protein [Kaistia terrae]MCX5577641.1 D-alanyl-D-alanine carboxypeptidase [Kaistia terrae]